MLSRPLLVAFLCAACTDPQDLDPLPDAAPPPPDGMVPSPPPPPAPSEDPAWLTRVVTEPPGEACVAGGAAVLGGHDRDADGSLGEAETETIAYVCSEVLVGDYVISSADDVPPLADVRVILGTLRVVGAAGGSLELPALAHVQGSLVLHETWLTRLALPALESIGGNLRIASNAWLTEIVVPTISAGHVMILENQRLATVDLRLRAPRVAVNSNPALEELRLAIRDAEVNIENNPSLRRVTLDVPLRAGAISIEDNPLLDDIVIEGGIVEGDCELRAPSLRRLRFDAPVEGHLVIAAPLEEADLPYSAHSLEVSGVRLSELPAIGVEGDVVLRGNPGLTRVALSPQRGDLTLEGNPSLTTVRMSYATEIGVVSVHDNPELRDFVIAGRQANVTARALSLLRNPKLQTAEIVNIDSVRGTLRISGSPLLQDLQFDLRTVGGDLYLYETGLRNTLDFFYLVFVGGDLEVKRNPVLRDECVSDLFDWVTTAGEEIASENGGPLPCYGP